MISMLKDLKDSNLNDNSAEYLQSRQQQQYNLSSIDFKMKIFMKLILICLLCVAINTQSHNPVDQATYYTEDGQSYLYIYGQGAEGAHSIGQRDANSVLLSNQYNKIQTKATGPTPVKVDCPYNQVYDNRLCICVCIIGYYYDGEACVPNVKINAKCKKNQIYQDGRCVCNKGFFLIGDVCDVCPPYSTYDLSKLSCICATGYVLSNGRCSLPYNPPIVPLPPSPPKCGINQRLINNICICRQDFYFINGQCTYCAAPNTYDPQLSICKPKCDLNEVLDINTLKCVCASGFNDVNGACGKCRPYSTYNKKTRQCDCVQGYVLNNYNCIPATHAPVKPTPLTPPPVVCKNNQNFVNGQCICVPGYYLMNGECSQCPAGTFFDATLQICRIPCNANQVYNILTKVCDCAKDTFRIGGVCTKCPGQTIYDAKSKLCICQPGYSNVNGVCVLGCGVNQVLSNGICCCKTGYYPIGGVCGRCGWDEVYDQGLGICRVPCDQKRIYNIAQRKCVCLPHFYELANGVCTTCPVHSTYDKITKSCVCNEGYIKNLGLCISACNNYEQFVNGKCVCKTGYYLIGYNCGVCPPLQVYDSTYRICRFGCKSNEVWDITIRACRCLPGFYLVQGVCSQCNPLTQIYDQKNQCCQCKSGFFRTPGQGCNGVCIPRCTENEDWLGDRCVCKPGFYLINNFCTKCPEGQFYDIYQRICRHQCGINQVYNFNSGKCDCARGFVIIQGACSKCPEGYIYDQYKQQCKTNVCPGVNQYYSETTGLCVCQSRYVRIRGVCTNCPPGYYYDSYSDSCQCKPGFKQVNGFCQPVCPLDQTYVNGRCQCNDGSTLINGICTFSKRCPLYSSFDKSSDCCVCNPGYSMINGQCTTYQYCGLNGYLKYGKCYCKQGFFWILNRCQTCGQNQAYNGVVCQCLIGFTRNINGKCIQSSFVPNCYKNQRYDQKLKACVCTEGTQFINSKCVKVPTCGENSYYNGLSCVCRSGYTLQNNACTVVAVNIPDCPDNAYFNGVSCTCNSGYSRDQNNGCSLCPSGTQWDGTKCASTSTPSSDSSDSSSGHCTTGYTFNSASNQCEPEASSCGENSIWNGAVCVCTSGAHQINGNCQICQSGTTFDGQKCVDDKVINTPTQCGSNQIYVNSECVCAAGFNDIGGQCIKCPEHTEWNGKYCACKISDVTKWCVGSPYTVFSNGSCNCQTGHILTHGLCTSASH